MFGADPSHPPDAPVTATTLLVLVAAIDCARVDGPPISTTKSAPRPPGGAVSRPVTFREERLLRRGRGFVTMSSSIVTADLGSRSAPSPPSGSAPEGGLSSREGGLGGRLRRLGGSTFRTCLCRHAWNTSSLGHVKIAGVGDWKFAEAQAQQSAELCGQIERVTSSNAEEHNKVDLKLVR